MSSRFQIPILVCALFAVLLILSCRNQEVKQDAGAIATTGGDETATNLNISKEPDIDPIDDMGPKPSPDGKKIAFYSYRDGNENGSRIYVVDSDGKNLKRLKYNDTIGVHSEPFWSKDGKEIVYANFWGNGAKLMIMNADGSNVRTLMNHNDKGFHQFGSWDDDGKGFYFTYWEGKDNSFTPNLYYTRNSTVKKITDDNSRLRCYLAQNKRLYFTKIMDIEKPDFKVYSSNLNGTDMLDLEEASGKDLWFPGITGDHNLFTHEGDNSTSFYSMDLQGGNIKELGTVPGKPAQFYTLDDTESYIVYNFPGARGSDIHKLDIRTGKVLKITNDN